MAKLDDQLAKLDEQMAEFQERMAALKAKKTDVLTQKRLEEKRKHDRVMLLLGRVIEHGLQSDKAAEKRNAQLSTIRSLVDSTFTEKNARDRDNLLAYLDHLESTLEPLPSETPDSSDSPQATPGDASISRGHHERKDNEESLRDTNTI